jgi:hypothetical protein
MPEPHFKLYTLKISKQLNNKIVHTTNLFSISIKGKPTNYLKLGWEGLSILYAHLKQIFGKEILQCMRNAHKIS